MEVGQGPEEDFGVRRVNKVELERVEPHINDLEHLPYERFGQDGGLLVRGKIPEKRLLYVQAEDDTWLGSTNSTSPLPGGGLGNRSGQESLHICSRIVTRLLLQTEVCIRVSICEEVGMRFTALTDDIDKATDGQTGLGNVGHHNAFAKSTSRGRQSLSLLKIGKLSM
jgi:hypothetical protein